jgi:hypothetical protein
MRWKHRAPIIRVPYTGLSVIQRLHSAGLLNQNGHCICLRPHPEHDGCGEVARRPPGSRVYGSGEPSISGGSTEKAVWLIVEQVIMQH